MEEKRYNKGFWAFLEKYFFSKLPNYQKRISEIDEIIDLNNKYVDSFIYDEPLHRLDHKETDNVKNFLMRYYQNEIIGDANFREALYNTMKEGITLIDYGGDIFSHATDKLINDFNLQFLEDLGIEKRLIQKRELKNNDHVIGSRNLHLYSVDNIEEYRLSFEPKMIISKKIT